MQRTDCPACGAAVPAGSSACAECGSPLAATGGVEARVRSYWTSPDLGLVAGAVLALAGFVLLGAQAWLWGALALVLATAVLVVRWEAGRRGTGAALGTARARLSTHRRVVGARSRGQIELFRLRRELAELQAERSRAFQELGRATYEGDATAAGAATARVRETGDRSEALDRQIAGLVREMEERVRQAQGEAPPEPARIPEPFPPPDEGTPPEPARVPEPFPQPVPERSPDDPVPAPEPPPAPETGHRQASGAANT
jgi:hypothetical protein